MGLVPGPTSGQKTIKNKSLAGSIYFPGCIFGCFLMFYKCLSVFIDFYMVLMVSIGLNGYLNRYASNWTNFQLKWSILDPNRGILGNWSMGYWGVGTTLRELKVPSGIAPLNFFF